MNSASLIYGHLFSRRELLRATDLSPLTAESLRDYLHKNSSRLGVEAYQADDFGEGIDLRTGRYSINPVRVPVGGMKDIAVLVGTCLAEHEGGDQILDLKEISESYLAEVKSRVQADFGRAFPKRDWKSRHFSTYLISDTKDRFSRGRRSDYPILAVEEELD